MTAENIEQKPYVRLERLRIGYRTGRHGLRIVADSLDATLPSGRLTCLIGRNGTGKSTLLRTIAALQPTLGGKILIGEEDTGTLSQKDMARRVSIVLTTAPNTVNMDVAQLVALGRTPYTGYWGSLKAEDLRAVQRAMSLTDITRIARRVLDYPSKARLMRLLVTLAHEEGKTILLSTHDMEMALRSADRLWLMDNNSLTEGTTEQMAADGTIDRFTDGLMPRDILTTAK